MAGCGNTRASAKAVEQIITDYLSLAGENKIKDAKNLVEGEVDVITSATSELISDEIEVYCAIASMTSYETIDVNASERTAVGEANINLIIPEVNNNNYSSVEEIIGAINKDNTKSYELSLQFTFDEEKWYITEDSARKIVDTIIEVITNGDVSAIRKDMIIGLTDDFFECLANDDVVGAYSYTINSYDIPMDNYYGSAVFAHYYSNMECEMEVTSVSDSAATVTLIGTAPDYLGATYDLQMNSSLTTILEESILAQIEGGSRADRDLAIIRAISGIVVKGMLKRGTVEIEVNVTFAVDENGTYLISNADEVLPVIPSVDFDEIDSASRTRLSNMALNNLLEDGRITQAQYNDYMNQYFGYDQIISTVDGLVNSGISGDLETFNSYAEDLHDTSSDMQIAMLFLKEYYSRLSYTINIAQVLNNEVIVRVSGTAPDIDAIIDYLYTDENLAIVGAEYAYVLIRQGLDATDAAQDALINKFIELAAQQMDTMEGVPFERELHFRDDGDGNYTLTNGNDMIPDLSGVMAFNDFTDEQLMAVVYDALDLLVADGRISSTEYTLFSIGIEAMEF